jgi:hypothetical protein
VTNLPPKLQAISEDIVDLYSEYWKGAGCCLHITTDDFNIEDSSVDFCIEHAKKAVAGGRDDRGNTHDDCLALAHKIRALALRERAVLFGMKWCPTCEHYDAYDTCVTRECQGKLLPLPTVGMFYKDGHDRFTIAKIEGDIYTVESPFLPTETLTETELQKRWPGDQWEGPLYPPPRDSEYTVTLTLHRTDPDQDITCTIRHIPKVAGDIGMWTLDEAVDEDGNKVRTTQWENITLYERAKAGEDETGR